MGSRLIEIFEDQTLMEKIQKRLPVLFQIAEIECTRGGRVGMEVGFLRERILVALLVYKFGEENIKIPSAISPEEDVYLFGDPISVKAAKMGSKKRFGGVKLKWTVNGIKANEFFTTYFPQCDLLMAQICWGKTAGGLYYIPMEVQQEVFKEIGPENYIKLPKPRTNSRGIEILPTALVRLVQDHRVRHFPIEWQKSLSAYSSYQRWLELWKEE